MKRVGFFLKDRLNADQVERFKLFEDEELIIAVREHWLTLIARVASRLLLGIVLSVIMLSVIYFVLPVVEFAIIFQFLAVLITFMLVERELIHWSFHLYIATNKQIIEVHYSPLFSGTINSILLDQIRCTEIDVESHGIIPELIGIGSVEITFDRPTHKEQFVIKGVRSPRKIASLLSAQIHQGVVRNGQTATRIPSTLVWTRELEKNKYRFLGGDNYGYTAG